MTLNNDDVYSQYINVILVSNSRIKLCKFIPKVEVGMLKDKETIRLFTREMAARNDNITNPDYAQKKWLLMNETWLKGSKQVCGITKGLPRH